MEEDARCGPGEVRRVPILAHTAEGSRVESVKSGMDAVVGKPIEEEALVRALMDAFGHSGLRGNKQRTHIAQPPLKEKGEHGSFKGWLV